MTTDVDPELDEVPPHYEVEIKTSWGEFDYIVDAFTGEVLRGQKDLLNYVPEGNGQSVEQPNTGTPDDGPTRASIRNRRNRQWYSRILSCRTRTQYHTPFRYIL